MVLSRTQSLCPVCMKKIPAQIILKEDDVYMDKSCAEHGSWSTILWRGNDPSWIDWMSVQTPAPDMPCHTKVQQGCPFDCGLCEDHQAPTCSVLIEVTERCNLGCPICFAQSEIKDRQDIPIDTLEEMFQSVMRSGGPYPLQLSGGEPTVRDDLPEIVRRAKELGFEHVQINTNGLRIAQDPDYLSQLKDSGADLIYLQLDGISDEVYMKIRGRRLKDIKRKALENCAELGIGVQLVPVIIRGVNDHELGGIVDLAKEFMPAVRGIHFQPVSFFGRFDVTPDNENRETFPDLFRSLEEQTGGELKVKDFVPRAKHDAHCGFSAFYILNERGVLSPTTGFDPLSPKRRNVDLTPAEHVRKFITEHSRYYIAPENECACMSAVRLNQAYARAKKYSLSISGMPFMDVWNFDLERVRNCCIHVSKNDGRLIPFCANYVTDINGSCLPQYRQES